MRKKRFLSIILFFIIILSNKYIFADGSITVEKGEKKDIKVESYGSNTTYTYDIQSISVSDKNIINVIGEQKYSPHSTTKYYTGKITIEAKKGGSSVITIKTKRTANGYNARGRKH